MKTIARENTQSERERKRKIKPTAIERLGKK